MNVKYKYTAEVEDYLRKNIPGHTYEETCFNAEKTLGVKLDPAEVKRWAWNREIYAGVYGKCPIPKEGQKYVLENYAGVGPSEMAERINKMYGTSLKRHQIKAFYSKHGLKSGLTGQWGENGRHGTHTYHPTERNIATQFKPGQKPSNTCDIGTLTEREGYLWRKIGPGRKDWKQEHVLIWESKYGPKPKGTNIIFLDGDTHNLDLKNLKCVTKAEHLEMVRTGMRFEDAELTEIGANLAKLTVAVRNAKRR